jgi:hypothetical protein
VAENRGTGKALPSGAAKIGIPTRVFLFTVDQLSVMLDLDEQYILKHLLYLEGRSIGSAKKQLMQARNIAPADQKPEWRVAEREFVRWMRVKGFKYYDRGSVY